MTRELCKVMNDIMVFWATINQDCYSEVPIIDGQNNILCAGNGFGEEGNGDISDWF